MLHGVTLSAQGFSVATISLLPGETHQTSGLIIVDDLLVTHNDGAEGPSLFELDPDDASIIREVAVNNATNVDWEDICRDNQFIYIADFGNNSGDRTDLRIYTVSLSDYSLGNNSVTVVDTIKFTYEDQVSFIPGNSHNFDAEALIEYGDSLYIFTKHRLDTESNIYSLSKTPGDYQAKKVGNINSQGQISGGTYNQLSDEIVLTGYNSGAPFLLQISNFIAPDFDGGQLDRYEVTIPGSHQIEAVEAIDDQDYFVTSETRTGGINVGPATLYRANAIAPNAAPTVTITAPADGHTVVEGTDITFTATATDVEDDDATLTAAIDWTSNLETGSIGTGGSFNTSTLSVGTHTITASVTDSNGEPGSDNITVTVNVNAAPVVNITAPADGHTVVEGTNITFTATATDVEDDDATLTAAIDWTSNLETGSIGTGGSFNTSTLSVGTHTITASVTDSNGEPGSDNITVTVNVNNAPVVNITAPADGHTVLQGTDITFTATATDVEDDDATLTAAIDWTSNLETGSIGTGGSFNTSTLSVGTHTITASVTDSNGEPGTDNITVTINVNAAPVVNITSPSDGVNVPMTTSITFTATATDEDGDLSAGLSWVSDLDGGIGTGATFNYSTLTPGTHIVTASVQDSEGVEGSDAVIVNITNTAAVVSITSPTDGTTVEQGTSIMFAASAIDAEEGDLSPGLTWIASLDGGIGSGASFSTSSLSIGTQSITASVIDGGGLASNDAVTVTVTAVTNPPTATAVSISGSTEVGQTLTGNYTYNDAEGDLESGTTFRWLRDNVAISGATSQTYTLVAADEGTNIIFEVTPGAATGPTPGSPVQSSAVGPISPANTAPTATGVSITGTTEVGFTLTGNYTYNDADGDSESGTTFRWLRNGSPIGGATSQTYTLAAADEGTNIIFEVTPGAATGPTPGSPVQSSAVGPIAPANTAPTATGVSITGTTEVGFTLTGNYTYNDADGDSESGTTFRWLRNGSPIGGATSQTYTLVVADEGTNIIFEVTPGAATGPTPGSPVQSSAVGPIAPANTAPTATGVSITGTTEVGFTLTGNYTYNDADGDTESGTTFRWLRDGSAISGATSQTYTLVAADEGTNIRFEVTPAAASGVSPGSAVQSAAVGPIGAANTAPTATGVSITGTTEVGFTLTGNYTYNDADGDTESGTTFRWLRNGSAIGGATSQTYALVVADQGTNIRFEVTPAAASGVSPGSAVQSAAVGPIAPANTAPTATGVSISGTTEVGFTLTGNYTYNDADGDTESGTAFRWLRNGSAIGGATSQTYTLVAADQGTNIRFEVTPAAASGVSPGSAVQSAAVGPIAPANTAPTATGVSINGTTEVGFTLTGNYTYNDADGDTESGTTFRWLRNGSAIGGATSQTYTLVAADQGTNIRFEVTPAAASGVSPGSAVQSAAVGPIAPANTAPTATGVSVTGTTIEGQVLTGQYTYADADSDPEGTSTFRWFRGNTVIAGATNIAYSLVAADVGANISFEVTPVAQTGVSPGSAVRSPSVGPIVAANSPPTNITLSSSSVPENQPVNTVVGTFSTTDPDNPGDSHTYTLVAGAGSADNGSFNINNNQLRTSEVFNFEVDNSYSIRVQTEDAAGSTFSKQFTISITNVNDLPLANDDLNNSTTGTASVTINAAANDTDEDGSVVPASAAKATNPTNGTAVNNGDGTFTYTPNAGFEGGDSFTYTIDDNSGATSLPGTIVITVGPNSNPVANDDLSNTTLEDVALVINVIANDTDSDGSIDPASITISTNPSKGTAQANNDGTVTYTPNPDENGTDEFSYSVRDNLGAASNQARVRVNINPVNDPPVANNDSENTAEETPVTIDVLANDNDLADSQNGGSIDPTTVNVVSGPSNGSVQVNTDGTITYTPSDGFNGSDTFTYNVRDNSNAVSNDATVTVNVSSVNDPPTAVNDPTNPTTEDNAITINVVANDTDSDGSVIPGSVLLIDLPTNGLASNNGDGTVTYTPNENYNGNDSFTYTVEDDQGAVSNIATVSIQVAGTNDPPVAVDDANNSTNEDTPLVINITANDSDPDGTIDNSSIIASVPANGTVTILTGGNIRYTPNQDFNGSDSFNYTVKDDGGAISNVAVVSIVVNDINDPPTAVNDVAVTDEDQEVLIDLIGNDVDVDGNLVIATLTLLTNTINGLLEDNGNGTVNYVPNPDFNGQDSFTYTIEDDDNAISNVATVTITINDINDAPVANDDAVNTDEDVTVNIPVILNDTDVDGSIVPGSITVVSNPANGSLLIKNDGTVDYTPDENYNGLDTYTYTVQDNDGALSNIATVTISVNDINDALVARNDTVSTNEDTAVQIDVLANDEDPDTPIDPSSVTVVTNPINGTAEVNADGTVTYTPNLLYNGPDSFTYNVKNTGGQVSNFATVIVNVTDVNNLPVAANDSIIVFEDEVSPLNILENDTDPDGTIAASGVSIQSGPTNGTIQTTAQQVLYTPDMDFTGFDEFTYTVADDDGGVSNVATAVVTVRNVNDPPSDLILSNSFVDEVTPLQTVIGTFNTIDIDTAETFTYSLVAGDGGEDNGAFSIFEDQLISQVTFNQQQKDEYFIRVKTDDGDSSYEKTFTITIFSITNPIGITPGEFPELHPMERPMEEYPITVDDDVEIDKVIFRYRGIASERTVWEEIVELESADRSYLGAIPADAFDELGIYLEFVVINTDGGSINLPWYTYNEYTGDGLDFEDLVFGEQQYHYNLFSIPLDLDEKSIPLVFEELGVYDKTLWRLFGYQNGNYIEYLEGLNALERGKGYWLIVKDQITLDTGSGNTKLLGHQPFNLQLDQGWNLIGNPYGFNINWLEVRRASPNVSLDTEVWIWDNDERDHVPTSVLSPFEGAFVFVEQDATLPVPVTKDPSIQGGRKGSIQQVNDEDNWEVELSLSSANFSNSQGGLGMRQDADQSKDQYDHVRLPRFINYLDFNFPKPEYFAPEFSKDIVPTNGQHVWEFTVETNLSSSDIRLEWSEVSAGDHQKELWLYHKDQEVIVNMQQEQHYDFTNQGTHNFAVYYGSRGFIESELLPAKAVLTAAYPNPFTKNVTILFSLPERIDSDFVRLSVYDVMGRSIKQVWEDQYQPGFYKVVWDGTNASGNRIASGTYLIRLELNGQKSIFKRVIKK